jgi:hypothetical protein
LINTSSSILQDAVCKKQGDSIDSIYLQITIGFNIDSHGRVERIEGIGEMITVRVSTIVVPSGLMTGQMKELLKAFYD